MMASTHVVLGLTCWAAFERAHGVHALAAPEALLMVSFASLLPDIDHPQSKFGRLIPMFSYPISAIFGHRGITHSLLAVVAMITAHVFYGDATWVITPLVIGYLSHLAGDLFTNSGVPLLWPRGGKYSIPVLNTGGILEVVVRVALVLVFATLIWQSKGLPVPHQKFWY